MGKTIGIEQARKWRAVLVVTWFTLTNGFVSKTPCKSPGFPNSLLSRDSKLVCTAQSSGIPGIEVEGMMDKDEFARLQGIDVRSPTGSPDTVEEAEDDSDIDYASPQRRKKAPAPWRNRDTSDISRARSRRNQLDAAREEYNENQRPRQRREWSDDRPSPRFRKAEDKAPGAGGAAAAAQPKPKRKRPERKLPPLPAEAAKMLRKGKSIEEMESEIMKHFESWDDEEEYYDPDDEGYEDYSAYDSTDVEVEEGAGAGAVAGGGGGGGEGSGPVPVKLFKLRPATPNQAHHHPEPSPGQAGGDAVTAEVKKAKKEAPKKETKAEKKKRERKERKKAKAMSDKAKAADAPYDRDNVLSLESLGEISVAAGSFEEAGMTPQNSPAGMLGNLREMGILQPTSVQAAALQSLLVEGRDGVLHAPTGSGKTLAYLLPAVCKVDPDRDVVQVVVVVPSRELGAQVANVLNQLLPGTGITPLSLIGGANINRQIENLKKKRPQVVVGTPGRLADLVIEYGRLRVGHATVAVLDEVDMLLESQFRGEVDHLMQKFNSQKQVVFASATGRSEAVEAAMADFMVDGVFVGGTGSGSERAQALPPNVAHTFISCRPDLRLDNIRRLISVEPAPEGILVFTNDQHKVQILLEKLLDLGIVAAPLSGESSKDDRKEAVRRLQKGQISVLVSTELAARGLDVPQLTHVVNYDLPTDAEHYVHRAGRCGRAGKPGIVVSFTTPKLNFVLTKKFAPKLGIEFQEIEAKYGKLILKSPDEEPSKVADSE